MNTMPVALFNNRARAEGVRLRLIQNGIQAEIQDKPRLGAMWFISAKSFGARLDVPSDQFERALRQLQEWDQAEGVMREALRCPECGSLRVEYPQYARNSLLTNLAMGLAAAIGLIEKDFCCEDCHYTWPREGARPRLKHPHLAPYYFIEGIEQTNQPLPPQKPKPSQPSDPSQRKAA